MLVGGVGVFAVASIFAGVLFIICGRRWLNQF